MSRVRHIARHHRGDLLLAAVIAAWVLAMILGLLFDPGPAHQF